VIPQATLKSFNSKKNDQNPSSSTFTSLLPSSPGGIQLSICNPTNLEIGINTNKKGLSTFIDISDGKWHLISFTWNSEDGRVIVYENGIRKFNGGPYRVQQTIESMGTFALGQLLSPLSNCIRTTNTKEIQVQCQRIQGRSFIGQLQHVFLWDRILSSTEIQKVLKWPMKYVTVCMDTNVSFFLSFFLSVYTYE
jgi:hypothetical protein